MKLKTLFAALVLSFCSNFVAAAEPPCFTVKVTVLWSKTRPPLSLQWTHTEPRQLALKYPTPLSYLKIL